MLQAPRRTHEQNLSGYVLHTTLPRTALGTPRSTIGEFRPGRATSGRSYQRAASVGVAKTRSVSSLSFAGRRWPDFEVDRIDDEQAARIFRSRPVNEE